MAEVEAETEAELWMELVEFEVGVEAETEAELLMELVEVGAEAEA